jgi:NAD(P)-dependent dehydrogenase (short-subunit alcohol dehydrogenase family)
MPRLDGKIAVVTGAAAGPKAALGAIFAKALAAEGAKVVLADSKDCAPSRRRDRSQRWKRARRPC